MHRTVSRIAATALVLTACAAATSCGEESSDAEGAGYVLLDRDARAAGIALEIGDTRFDGVVPVAIASDETAYLVQAGEGLEARTPIHVARGELVHVTGAEGTRASHGIGDDVDPDRLAVYGDDDAILALAEALHADATGTRPGTSELHGHDLVAAAAEALAHEGITDVEPVALDEGATASPKIAGAPMHLSSPKRAVRAGLPTIERALAKTPEAPTTPVIASAPTREATPNMAETIARLEADKTLPKAVSCADPAVGTWKSHDYEAAYREWATFTLHVHRDASTGALVGTIENDYWNGESTDASLPSGAANGAIVTMPAKGSTIGDTITFGGTSWKLTKNRWRPGESIYGYNPDVFTGKIVGTTFAAVNNDGGRMVDYPTAFRRVSCK